MDQPGCPVCLDLSHDRFEPGDNFVPFVRENELARYRTIEFHDLRIAAAAGCPSCSILDQGIGLFWGTRPEDWKFCDDGETALLVLESRPGKSLMAFRSVGGTPEAGIFVRDMRIEFFRQDSLDGDEPFPMVGYARPVSRSLSKDMMVSHLRGWLRACGETHTCSSSPRQDLPTRLLDISGDSPRLVESRDIKNHLGRYVTLSHCWGDSDSFRPTTTTKQTFESHQGGISASELSPLFRDAIELCKGIGCDYIWIDSLCIIQDDDLDWKTESQKMAQVYSNAYFNIAATRCADSADGLFEDRWTFGEVYSNERHLVQEHRVGVCPSPGNPIYARISHDRDHRYVQARDISPGGQGQAPLLARAWVLQEVLLAHRVLHVCASELVWECEDLYDCECGSFSSTPSAADPTIKHSDHRKREFAQIRDGRGLLSTKRNRDFWLEISAAYSALAITKHSDRPIALAGLADAVHGPLNKKVCYGIWIEDLPRALLWRERSSFSDSTLRSGDVPTWSWMSGLSTSNNYRIAYDIVLHGGFTQEPRTSVSITLRNQEQNSSSDEKKKMQPQSITFRGPVLLGRKVQVREIDGDMDYQVHLDLDSTAESSHPGATDALFYADCPEWPEDPLRDGDTVACLLFGTSEGFSFQYVLVVKICSGMEEEEEEEEGIVYCRRVGLRLPDLKLISNGAKINRFEDAEIKTMRII